MTFEQANVNYNFPGIPDVNNGMMFSENRRIIVHDRGKFEGGDEAAVRNVEDFIRRRRNKKVDQGSDSLHFVFSLSFLFISDIFPDTNIPFFPRYCIDCL